LCRNPPKAGASGASHFGTIRGSSPLTHGGEGGIVLVKQTVGKLFVLAVIFLFAAICHAQFYKYVDKDGNICFTDNLQSVPPEQRKATEVYTRPERPVEKKPEVESPDIEVVPGIEETARTEPEVEEEEAGKEAGAGLPLSRAALRKERELLDREKAELNREIAALEKRKAELEKRKGRISLSEYNRQIVEINEQYARINRKIADYNRRVKIHARKIIHQ